MRIPKSLRTWFIIHFVIDIIFAIPLMFFPTQLGSIIGLTITEPLGFRLVGAALFGIGTISLIARNKGRESYQSLILLKILWASAAILALLLSLLESINAITVLTLILFIIFLTVWTYYHKKLQ